MITVEQQAARLSTPALAELIEECRYHLTGPGQVTGHTLWNSYNDRRIAAKAELARRENRPEGLPPGTERASTPVAPPTRYAFDYAHQAWLTDIDGEGFRYVRCGHRDCIIDTHGPVDDLEAYDEKLRRTCYGTRHVGERPHPGAAIH